MRIDDVITESINPDILNPDFQHRQKIDGFVYTAESKVYFNKLDTLKIRCYNHKNEEIASVLFEVKQGKWLQAVQVVVEPEYRGEGLANTMYAYAKMLGNTIKPSGTQTDQGKAMWAKWGADARHLTHEDNKIVRETELSEAFDQPRGIDWEQSEESEAVDAIARLSDGTALTVMFEPEAWTNDSPTDWSVSFWRGNSQEVTGAGNAQEVFATVLSAIRQFVHAHNPESIEFSASKDPQVDMAPYGTNVNPESRAKLYDRMVNRYASAMGYQVQQQQGSGKVTYTLRQVKKSVTEDQDYMAGHCHVMAIALKMLHPDWQIRAHVGWEDDAAEDNEYRVDHVYIVAPDGSAYDCRGRFDSEEALVGEDVTGGFETQYADFDLADIEQLVQRGELKRFTREDINKAMAFAKRIQQ